MLQFVLTINVATDISKKDIALALRRVASALERTNDPIEDGDNAPIRDLNGQRVGEWEITS